jgi:23S rRNA (pseudouridine1915-N3)-methyltransferase
MLIKLLCVGKTHSTYISQGLEDYVKRVNKYSKFEVSIVPDIKNVASLTPEQRKTEEGKLILQQIQPTDWIVLLDEKGKEYTSEEFSAQWQNWFNRGSKQIVCIVGGPYGFSKELYEKANAKIALSKMTFSHEMVRLFFAEQLYRSFTIIKNEPYHHR